MLIETRNGRSFIIDDEDESILRQYRWWVQGSSKKGFYVVARRSENGKEKKVLLHRILMNAPDGMVVDHINRDTMDNRKANLRVCSIAENNCNQKQKSSSPSKNVIYEARNKGGVVYRYWTAKVTFQGRRLRARFPYTEDGLLRAIDCAAEFRKELHGDFAYTR